MSVSKKEFEKLNGYRFSLIEYQLSHSTLTLSTIDPEKLSNKFNLHFVEVCYIQMPMSWIGNFEVGSELEREALIEKTGLPIRGFSSAIKLYKANEGGIRILGALMLIEPANTE